MPTFTDEDKNKLETVHGLVLGDGEKPGIVETLRGINAMMKEHREFHKEEKIRNERKMDRWQAVALVILAAFLTLIGTLITDYYKTKKVTIEHVTTKSQ